MSRYGDEGDDYYDERRRARSSYTEGGSYDSTRRERPRGRDYGYGDPSYTRESERWRSARDWRDYDDYGRRPSDERDAYRSDYSSSAVGHTGERIDYGRYGYGPEGRSRYEESRDDARRRFGRRDEGRGASRSHVRCRDIMTRDVTVATRNTTLEEVAALMRDEDTGVIPVVDRPDPTPAATGQNVAEERRETRSGGNGKLIGLVTDRDVVVRAIAEGKDARTTRVEEIMTSDVHTAGPNDRVIDAIRKMGDKQVRRIPIVDKSGNLRGIISMADIALETEEDRELANALEEISSGSSFWSKIFG